MELIQHNTTNKLPAILQIALEQGVKQPLALHKAIAILKIEQIDQAEMRRRNLESELKAIVRNLDFCQKNMPDPAMLDNLECLEKQILDKLEMLPTYPRLASLRKADEGKVTDDVILLLCWLQEQLNVVHNLSDSQIEMLAVDIVQGYGSFRLEDIAACFKFGLRGAYGKIFERIDANVIHTWLRAYQQQRIDSHEQQSYESYLSTKESTHRARHDAPTPMQVKETFNLLYPKQDV